MTKPYKYPSMPQGKSNGKIGYTDDFFVDLKTQKRFGVTTTAKDIDQ